MISGSATLRVGLLIVVAAALAGLASLYWAPATPLPAPAELAKAPPAEPAPKVEAPPPPAPVPAPPPVPEPAPPPAPVAAEPPAPEPPPSASEQAAENAPPAATELVDLNTASLADLNKLRGGGAIGRAIIQHRPYSAVDQLLSKRVLTRATYQRIKDQVTVR
ncbi:ComEA family DNA-binding protein [Methylobacterium organophilum]|uniref:Helix-hairpin-helix domain-containing protein n=1 Tax=Methylobacterium organophilum TaxID=410 RepID=A0ABQ4TDB7_METOR|nr:helix-hairpin-helix domain-containing protein [Methylobacterium organophilum]GJE28684.1 hypothetical protein LKMONMHP_3557 [Methylobacterium organophilum]